MGAVGIFPAEKFDALVMAPMMREADALEVRRAGGYTPEAALLASLEASHGRAWSAWADGQPLALFGIVQPEVLGHVGIPWLLTSTAIEKHRKSFLRIARDVVAAWSSEFPTLLQFVDAEYVSAHRFLRALGFTLYPPVEYGPLGAPFLPAVRSQNV